MSSKYFLLFVEHIIANNSNFMNYIFSGRMVEVYVLLENDVH